MLNRSFDILARETDIHKSLLLEASAGTGKTFSIENLVVRLLVEGDVPLGITEILVVTFTRKATLELKERIRFNIIKICQDLKNNHSDIDYVKGWIESRQSGLAIRRLENALMAYDEAQIYTIHSFCFKMLQENVFDSGIGCELDSLEESLSHMQIREIIKDFFRTGIDPYSYSPQQLKIVLDKYNGDFDRLVESVAKNIFKKGEISDRLTFIDYFNDFKLAIKALGNKFVGIDLVEYYESLAPLFKGICNRKGLIKGDILKQLETFLDLLDKDICDKIDFDNIIKDGLEFARLLLPENKKKGKQFEGENYFEEIYYSLEPVVCRAADSLMILGRLAYDCRAMFQELFQKEEKFTFDYLLELMHKRVQKESFKSRVKGKYKAAIIDEFQDTDKLQWEIFYTLFFDKDRFLYLIGDPKQAIYAFRNADVYTYLDASKAFGEDSHFTLDTNYRSQPFLVDALNFLFSRENSPAMMPLPRKDIYLNYNKVLSSKHVNKPDFGDDKGSVHFSIIQSRMGRSQSWPTRQVEEEHLFPFVFDEIVNMEGKFSYSQLAVLVRDRYQAARLQKFLADRKVSASMLRSNSIVDSQALKALREVFRAVVNPKDLSAVKVALTNDIFGLSIEEIREIFDKGLYQEIISKFFNLRQKLYNSGFSQFYASLKSLAWNGKTILENMLGRVGGREFYHQLTYLSELIISYQSEKHASPEGISRYLDYISSLDPDDDEKFKLPAEPVEDAVTILTMHISKGLEFDVVFAIGLAYRGAKYEDLISIHKQDKDFLVPCNKDAELYLQYSQEADAEKMRQLYVTMTRAKYRLYIPVLVEQDQRNVSIGCASPMELFLSQLGQSRCSYIDQYQRIIEYNIDDFIHLLDCSGKDITYDFYKKSKFNCLSDKGVNIVDSLMPPIHVSVPQRTCFYNSFSSLAEHISKDSNVKAPSDFSADIKNIHTLPSSSCTGNILHKILEDLFLAGDIESLDRVICKNIEGTNYHQWNEVIYNSLIEVFNTPFDVKGDTIVLKEILGLRFFTEMKFLFNSDDFFLNGSIDLFFEYNARYYILDWKSNWLGCDDESYSDDTVERAMVENDYYLQAAIYSKALEKYLKLTEKRSFKDCFGGAIYCFLRGPAFYHFFPDYNDIEERLCKG